VLVRAVDPGAAVDVAAPSSTARAEAIAGDVGPIVETRRMNAVAARTFLTHERRRRRRRRAERLDSTASASGGTEGTTGRQPTRFRYEEQAIDHTR
jgi:hypothetical protein